MQLLQLLLLVEVFPTVMMLWNNEIPLPTPLLLQLQLLPVQELHLLSKSHALPSKLRNYSKNWELHHCNIVE